MPVPGRYAWNQSTGELTGVENANMNEVTTLRELSGGTVYTQGSQLVYSGNAFNRFTQGSSGDAYITLFKNGVIAVESQLTGGRLKINTTEGALYGVSGDINTVLSNGEQRTISIDQSLIAGIGQTVMAYEDDNGVTHFEAVTPGSTQDALLRDLYPVTYREATLGEAQEYAIRGWLHNNEDALIREEVGDTSGMTDAQARQARYTAIQVLAGRITSSLNTTKVHYVDPSRFGL